MCEMVLNQAQDMCVLGKCCISEPYSHLTKPLPWQHKLCPRIYPEKMSFFIHSSEHVQNTHCVLGVAIGPFVRVTMSMVKGLSGVKDFEK